jgi:hypothetical protein
MIKAGSFDATASFLRCALSRASYRGRGRCSAHTPDRFVLLLGNTVQQNVLNVHSRMRQN